jgi:eukaryotic-like serine/threonine-protein kinase
MDRGDQIDKSGRADDEGLKPTERMLVAGARVGPYQIEGPLGRGGMGQVYRARDTRLGRPVALKFLTDATAGSAEALDRFRREAQAISALNHPNVCTVYDIGDEAGRPFLVMELMEGRTLKERNAAGPVSNQELIAIAVPVLEALEAAHACGIVHRDIKPANIFLTRQGAVKILDFGLAKATGADPGTPLEDSLTSPGTTVGTVSYMSPEQACGQAVDARSDVFACGVVLYEMASGTLPFKADSWAATVAAVLNRTPRRLGELRPDILPEIESVVARALEKDPKARYQSAGEMRAGLVRIQGSQGAPVRKRPGMMWAIGSAAALFALAGAGWYFGARNRPVTSPSEYIQLTDFSDSAVAPALSRDGRVVAFFRGGLSFLTTSPIYAKLLPDGQATQLTSDSSRKYGLTFTPDGSRVAYTVLEPDDEWSTWTVPVTRGAPARIMRNAAGLTWIGDGRILFSEVMSGTSLHMGIVTAQESRAGEREIYFPGHERAMAHYSHLSPDRKSILAVEMDQTARWQRCRLLPVEGGPAGAQVGPEGACFAAAWSPDGKWMYFDASVQGASHLWRQRFPGGVAEQITFGPGEEEGLAVSPDGKSVISSVGVHKSSVWIHDGSGERAISVEGSATLPRIPADGKRVYYLLRKNASAASELWSADWASGQSSAALPGVSMTDFAISRDGQQVAFTSQEGKGSQILVAPLDGSAPPRLIARDGDGVAFGAPGELVFRQLGAQVNYLARVKTDGTGLARVLNQPITDLLAVSPDGSLAAIGGDNTSLVSLKDGTLKQVCSSVCLVHWPAAGGFLYLTINPDWANGGATVALPLRRGEWVPQLEPAGIVADAGGKIPGSLEIHEGELAPGADPRTYAFSKLEFVGNLFRIPLH